MTPTTTPTVAEEDRPEEEEEEAAALASEAAEAEGALDVAGLEDAAAWADGHPLEEGVSAGLCVFVEDAPDEGDRDAEAALEVDLEKEMVGVADAGVECVGVLDGDNEREVVLVGVLDASMRGANARARAPWASPGLCGSSAAPAPATPAITASRTRHGMKIDLIGECWARRGGDGQRPGRVQGETKPTQNMKP